MPILTLKSVHSFSSEDPSFPATNLLSSTPSTGKKWKSKSAGESSMEVVLQLENPSTITAIDIGNEHSAFIEVLVSKNGSSNFQQILLTSSFMSPVESRNSDPVNRVRCFSRAALDETVVESKTKWDLVKVICTQPFNKRVQYGLSFIKLHSSDAKDSTVNELSSVPQKFFGNFRVREDSPDSESESSQSLFSRWKGARNGEQSPSVPLSAAAAIRKASTTASLKNHSPQVNRTSITPKRIENRLSISEQQDEDDAINKKNRNRSELMYEEEDDEPNEKLDKVILKERERLEREKNEKKKSEKKQNVHKKESPAQEVKKNKFKDSDKKDSSSASASERAKNVLSKLSISDESDGPSTSTSKRNSSPILVPPPVKRMKPTKERTYKPFNKLLEGVVLVISGIQNPTRAEIRQQALDMGARYKPDWEGSSTHLICAFKNTPKYNQVHGQGKIITKDWILECHKKKMRIPWRRFALDGDDAAASESEDEIYDKSLQPSESSSQQRSNETNTRTEKRSPKKLSQSKSQSSSPAKSSRSAIVLSDDDNDSIDRYNLNSSPSARNEFVSSGSDTEDEIRRVLEKKTSSTVRTVNESDDIYNATTEEEGSVPKSKTKPVTPIPEFLKGKKFYLSSNISSTDEIKLKRFIGVYGGEMTSVASNSDYILSNSPKATPAEYKGEVVKPLWIIECNDLEVLLPTQRYNFSDW